MNLPIYIACSILITIITITIILIAVFYGRYNQARQNPSKWCYADWNCGTDGTPSLNAANKNTSPVLESMPILYTNRVDNVGNDSTGNFVCPVQIIFDYEMNTTVGDSKYSKLVPVASGQERAAFYINDNAFNGNPVKKGTSTPSGGIPSGTIDQCILHWSKPFFDGRKEDIHPSIGNPTEHWPIKGYFTDPVANSGVIPNTDNVRGPPVGWAVPADYNKVNTTNVIPGTGIPTFKVSTILKQQT